MAPRRRCPLNWNGKQLPVGFTLQDAADPRLQRPEQKTRTVSKELRKRVGMSESVERGDGELVCVSERDALGGRAPPGEKPRSCGDFQWGGTLCERQAGAASRSGPGGAFRARDVSAAATAPRRDAPREGSVRPRVGSSRDLTSPGSRGGRACDVRVGGGPGRECPRLSSGRDCLPEARLS